MLKYVLQEVVEREVDQHRSKAS